MTTLWIFLLALPRAAAGDLPDRVKIVFDFSLETVSKSLTLELDAPRSSAPPVVRVRYRKTGGLGASFDKDRTVDGSFLRPVLAEMFSQEKILTRWKKLPFNSRACAGKLDLTVEAGQLKKTWTSCPVSPIQSPQQETVRRWFDYVDAAAWDRLSR
jgi:hypothetical protein